jgi:hypothetical protein
MSQWHLVAQGKVTWEPHEAVVWPNRKPLQHGKQAVLTRDLVPCNTTQIVPRNIGKTIVAPQEVFNFHACLGCNMVFPLLILPDLHRWIRELCKFVCAKEKVWDGCTYPYGQ